MKNVIGGQNDIILGCIAYIFNRAADNFKANLLKKALIQGWYGELTRINLLLLLRGKTCSIH